VRAIPADRRGTDTNQETKQVTTSRAIVLILRKKEMSSEYWLRLTKEKPNRNWVKTDFAKVSHPYIDPIRDS
jgi:hypothetical protein